VLFGIWNFAVGGPLGTLPGTLVALALVAYAALGAPWKAWFGERPDRLWVWLASVALTTLIWSLRAPILPGASFHFLLATMLTLMHGWRIALVGLSLVVLGTSAARGDLSHWSAFMLCDAVVPVLFIHLWHRLISRTLPRNFWVFFFVTTFFGSIAAFAASGLAKATYMVLTHVEPVGHSIGDYAVVLALMGFGEASLNGFIVASAMVFRPQWVASIDAETYGAKLT